MMKNRAKKSSLFNKILLILLVLVLTSGCSEALVGNSSSQSSNINFNKISKDSSNSDALNDKNSTDDTDIDIDDTENAPIPDDGSFVTADNSDRDSGTKSFSLSDVPVFSDSPYATVNGNTPYFSNEDLTTKAFEYYSPLDSLGRCGVAYANICKEIMPTEKRGSIGQIKPYGWHTVKYSDLIEDNYLYNRCHLIGYQLAGENANEKNLITGTRYMNVSGMLPFEDKVDDYVERTNNHVLYRVTPVFEGANLVATGVLMEALSVEDNGAGISFNVFCYNAQPGITIDYLTGDSFANSVASGNNTNESSNSQSATGTNESVNTNTSSPAQTYILNTNTHKFHYPNCKSVSQMADHNKKEYATTRDDIINMGYSSCGNCKP